MLKMSDDVYDVYDDARKELSSNTKYQYLIEKSTQRRVPYSISIIAQIVSKGV